jgi:heat shock protein HslJ
MTASHRGAIPLRIVAITSTLVLVAVAASCGNSSDDESSEGTPGPTDPQESLQGNDWHLDIAGSSPDIGVEATFSLTFGADTLSGQAACNTYTAQYRLSADGIEIDDIATTNRACEPALMDAEQVYLAALAKVTNVDDTDPERLLLSSDDDVRLSFETLDPAAEIVGSWTIVNLNTGDALTGPIEGTEPTLAFEADGTLSAFAGCNTLQSPWTVDGDSITIGPAGQTMMSCTDPTGVMEQEAALAAALEGATRVQITDQLTLFDDEDRMVVIANPSTP